MKKLFSPSVLMAASVFVALPGATFAQDSAPAMSSTVHGTAYELARHERTQSGTVTHVDQTSRFVTIRDTKGVDFAIQAGPEVRNFAQLREGDTVTATYQAATALELLPANSTSTGIETQSDSTRAPEGGKPGIDAGHSVSITSRISAVDLARHTVTLTGADGQHRVIEVNDPARQARMSKLKVGDMARVTYIEGTAVQVTPKAEAKP